MAWKSKIKKTYEYKQDPNFMKSGKFFVSSFDWLNFSDNVHFVRKCAQFVFAKSCTTVPNLYQCVNNRDCGFLLRALNFALSILTAKSYNYAVTVNLGVVADAAYERHPANIKKSRKWRWVVT